MTKVKKRHFIQKYPIIPILFFFLFAWAWLVLITTFKPSQKEDLSFKFEYFDQKTRQHFDIKNDSLILNKKLYYRILENKKVNGIRRIVAQNATDSIQLLLYENKVFIRH